MGLRTDVLDALADERLRGLRGRLGLCGYTLVGSGAYLPPESSTDADTDVVLMSMHGHLAPEVGLPLLLMGLRDDPRLVASTEMWYVQAIACLIKAVRGAESVDLLLTAGCDLVPAARFGALSAEEAVRALPADDGGSRAADCVHLTRRVELALRSEAPTAFTIPALLVLRRWAKARHIYGGRYGFPGGSAWMVLLMVYCEWYDTAVLPWSGRRDGCEAADVLWHLLLTLALWPWPLPFTVANVRILCQGHGAPWAGARALEGSVGRRLVTSFVVPLPCGSTEWNMTQCVAWPQHACLLREAWDAGLRRLRVGLDPVVVCGPSPAGKRDGGGGGSRWPLVLAVRLARPAPPQWDALVSSRLVATLGPQLDACGFFARPLCLDDPFVILLWPQEHVWSGQSRRELVLPLRKRVGTALFQMLWDAHRSLWPGHHPDAGTSARGGGGHGGPDTVPELRDLVPDVSLSCEIPPCHGPPAPAASRAGVLTEPLAVHDAGR